MQGTGGLAQNRSFWLLMIMLAGLFLAGLGLFTFLYRWGADMPRVDLPKALRITEAEPSFRGAIGGVRQPLAVAVSPDARRVYVAEGSGERAIRILDRAGQELAIAVPPGTDSFSRQPMSIAVGTDGTLYVADRALNQVLRFDPDGAYLGELPPPDDTRWAPVGVATDSGGNLYVAEALDIPGTERHRVLVFDAQGNFLNAFGSKGDEAAGMNFPHALAVDSEGRIYVATIDAVKVFDSRGTFLYALSGGGRLAPGLAMGIAVREERLFIADATNHRLLVYNLSEEQMEEPDILGHYGVDSGELRFPQGVWPSADGRVYVADRDNNRVAVWSY